MVKGQPERGMTKRRLFFVLAVAATAACFVIYGSNMVRWRNSPDFGWRTMYASGPNSVAHLMERGEAAGLEVGDTIEAINGRKYTNFDELFYQGIRDDKPGSVNTYTVVRDGKRVDIDIVTGRIGFKSVLSRSGIFFVLGLIYFMIGVVVFLMNPRTEESLVFLVMTCLMGMHIGFGAPSDIFRPRWFNQVRDFNELFAITSIIHLALVFPKKRAAVRKLPILWTVPYLFASVLMAISLKITWANGDPTGLNKVIILYYLVMCLVFLASTAWNILRDPSVVVRLQSQVIFIGIFVGFLVPSVELVLRNAVGVYFFPNPAVGFAVFLTAFPLSIGYTIVKHDLFAIDVIVRRTYGYILSTGTIVVAYSLIVSLLNVTFQSSEIARTPLFSIGFALAVVFTFRPLHVRIQSGVDRLFYRQRYDYRKTIKEISEAMTGLLDLDQIQRMLIGSVVREMFLENGLLLLAAGDGRTFRTHALEEEVARDRTGKELDDSNALIRRIVEKPEPVMRQELEINPEFAENRVALDETFESLESEMVLPLTYKDRLQGVVSLGRKKSGKMFTAEDLDLLKTMANQSAIALENARLMQENIEKGRMEEELKIAHDLQVSMLPERPPEMAGLQIAASCIAAREVGGDFFDFIEAEDNGDGQKLGLVVADVSGKAVSGALVMSATRSIFRVLARGYPSVRDVMIISNGRLKNDVKKGMFVALLYAVVDPQRKLLTLSNAGQTQPVLCPADGSEPKYIDTEGDRFPLGIMEDCDYRETEVLLKKGDTVIFYTDGVVEAMNAQEEMYGFDRFMERIEETRGLAPQECLDRLMGDVSAFTGDVEQHDDVTIVVMKMENGTA